MEAYRRLVALPVFESAIARTMPRLMTFMPREMPPFWMCAAFCTARCWRLLRQKLVRASDDLFLNYGIYVLIEDYSSMQYPRVN